MTGTQQERKRIILDYDKMNFCGTELELDLYTDVEPNSPSLDEYDVYSTHHHKLLARERWTITVRIAVPSSPDVDLLQDLLQDECYQMELDNKFKALFNKCYLSQLPYRTGPCLVLDFNAYALEDELLLRT